jgi:hypothetical protein
MTPNREHGIRTLSPQIQELIVWLDQPHLAERLGSPFGDFKEQRSHSTAITCPPVPTRSRRCSSISIKGGVEHLLKTGDVLYAPASVPHGFKDIDGFRAFLIRFDTK